jgi:outer membrane protein assembly factor BamB
MDGARRVRVWAAVMVACAVAAGAWGKDWPQWGGGATRGMVSSETDLPLTVRAGLDEAGEIVPAVNVKWRVRVGPLTYGHPVIAGGRVYLGTGDRAWGDPRTPRTRGGMLLCVDEKSGKVLWRLLVPRYKEKIHGSGFDDVGVGVCSCPTVEGDRLWVVSSRGEVLCMDVKGQADGNDGPYQDEGQYIVGPGKKPAKLYRGDGDILWRFDMIGSLPSAPHDATNCNVLVHGEYVYVCTGNGVHRLPGQPNPLPDAPSLIVLHKDTGRLVAADTEKIGHTVFHGQWSSPSLAVVKGREMILWGGGDGVLYAFQPVKPGTKPGKKPVPIKKLWWFDCNPKDFKVDADGQPVDYWDGDRSRSKVPPDWKGPSEIIATPVLHEGRVYVAVGRDPEHGQAPGIFHCVDPTGVGDVTATHGVWSYRKVNRTMASAAVSRGRVYLPDFAGAVHCLDADTGKVYWVHQTKERIWSSALVADGKVYVTTENRRMWVFAEDAEKKILCKARLPHKLSTSPVAANGTLYLACHPYLLALTNQSEGKPAQEKPSGPKTKPKTP